MKKIKNITAAQVRALLKIQNGRCAISGEKLKPADSSVDHIVPISRKELTEEKGYGKYWLVSSIINKLKGSITMEELYSLVDKINNNKKITKKLHDKILDNDVPEISKKDFDKCILENYDKDGVLKD